jgi:hypothetical protein
MRLVRGIADLCALTLQNIAGSGFDRQRSETLT